MKAINNFGKLFVLLSAMAVGTPGYAQYGNTVRQGIVWDNIFEAQDLYDWNSISYAAGNGYHFDGEREADGKTYAVYRDGDGKEVALLREDGGRVYVHIDSGKYLGDFFGGDSSEEQVTEGLLYDFTAKAGDKVSGVFMEAVGIEDCDNYIPHEMTVLDTFTVRIDGKQMRGQHIKSDMTVSPGIDDELIIIEGIGSNFGSLQAPQLIWPTSGGSTIYGFIDKVKDESGKIIFTRYDFLRFYKYAEKEHYTETNSLIREDRVWEYEAYTDHEWNSRYEYKMRFDGVTEIDGKIYNNLIVYDAFAYWSDWPDPELNKKELDHAEKYLLREESGKVYLHVPDDAVDEWSADRPEALIYDFNASEGDDMSVVSSGYGMCPAKVMSVYDVSVNGEKCRAYNIKREGGHIPMDNAENDEYIVIEGLGNIIWGCLPFFYTTLTTGAMSFPLCVPDFFWKESLYRVTDLDGNVICEKTDGKWPWERPDGVSSVEAEGGLSYDGQTVMSADSDIAVFDLSGKRVAGGRGSVSTAGLQPGVYVARTAGQSLKIAVR